MHRSIPSALAALGLLCAPGVAAAQDTAARYWNEVQGQDVAFPSGDVTLAGELWLPPDGVYRGGTLVLAHGSDQPHRRSDFAHLFATQGFVVLTYDKRGGGESGGALPGPYAVSPENLDLLARDAAAAGAWLAARPEAAGLPLGYWGLGQAGWTAPMAAVQVPEADFLVMWSATAMTVSDELERGLAEGESAADAQTVRGLIAELRETRTDPDPGPAIDAFRRPSLWIFGTNDNVIPADLGRANIQGLIDGDHPEIDLWINQGGGHDLDWERDRAIFDDMVEWMLSQQNAN